MAERFKMIPYGKQEITPADIDAVVAVLNSDFLTQGPVVPKFEHTVAHYCEAKYAVATSSATSALHIACLAVGLGSGDWLWTSAITFVASANCALYCGAKVDFVDIDPQTYNLSVQALEEKLIRAKKQQRLPKVVIPVHLAGQSCDMHKIHQLSQQYGFKIIEDAAHAIGGKYQGKPVGNGQYSDISIFSFHPVKIVTTGEGGIAVTNDKKLAMKMDLLRSHGITRDSHQMTKEPDGPWFYQQIELGFNYRMTDIQAALGVSQMDRLDNYIKKRHEIAARYNVMLKNLPISLPVQLAETFSAYHLYIIKLQQQAPLTHQLLFEKLRESSIGVNLHYIPVHTQPYYKKLGFKDGDFPQAEAYYAKAITLPLYPNLSEIEQHRIISVLQSLLNP